MNSTNHPRRCLSTPFTLLHKLYLYVFFAGGVIFLILLPHLHYRHGNGTPISAAEQWLAVLFWSIGTAPGLWYAGHLMRVRVDDDSLYVSNYGSEIAIPLADVSSISEGRLWRYFNATVTLHLRRPSPFGQCILFMPRPRLYWRGEHPAVGELRSLCERARASEK